MLAPGDLYEDRVRGIVVGVRCGALVPGPKDEVLLASLGQVGGAREERTRHGVPW